MSQDPSTTAKPSEGHNFNIGTPEQQTYPMVGQNSMPLGGGMFPLGMPVGSNMLPPGLGSIPYGDDPRQPGEHLVKGKIYGRSIMPFTMMNPQTGPIDIRNNELEHDFEPVKLNCGS